MWTLLYVIYYYVIYTYNNRWSRENVKLQFQIRTLRAITSAGVKNFPFYTTKTYFFYFTLLILQNSHISLSIMHLYFNKIFIFFFYYFLHLFSSLSLSLPIRPNHHHPHYPIGLFSQFENHSRLNHHPPKIRKPFKIKLRDQKPI